MEEMSHVYAKLMNQYKLKYQIKFLVLSNKNGEVNETISEKDLPTTLSITHNLTQSEIDNINIQWTLEKRIESVEMKKSGWNFQRFNNMSISFYKTGEINGTSYVKIPLGSSALINIKNDDIYCFIWSILASLHPGENGNPNRVSNYRQFFIEINIIVFDFSNGFRCSDMLRIEKLNNLSINIFELNFCQDQNIWKHKLIPIEVSKNESGRVVDLLIYKNHYVLIKKN